MVFFADNSTPFQRPGLPADKVRKIRVEKKAKKDGEDKVQVKIFEDRGER